MDDCNNRQNTIPAIPSITIPTIPAINIPFHQRTDALTEGNICRKGDTLSGKDGRIDSSERRINRTGGAHIRTDGRNNKKNTIPATSSIDIYILREH